MPAHFIPLAIVVAKIGASAVVSLAPVAMSREEDEHGKVIEERRRFRDFFKKEFYAKEFARLENEQLRQQDGDDDDNDEPTRTRTHDNRMTLSSRSSSRSSRAFSGREFASLRNERGVSKRKVRRE